MTRSVRNVNKFYDENLILKSVMKTKPETSKHLKEYSVKIELKMFN